MKMSGDFAATVAAVAPVVWLVGAVECQQVTKRLINRVREGSVLLTETLERLESASDEVVLAHEWSEVEKAKLKRPWPLLALFTLWGLLATSLAITTVRCIGWLGAEKPGPNPGEAMFCYVSIFVSFAVVLFTPIIAAVVELDPISRRHDALQRVIAEQRRAARLRRGQARVQNSVSPPP
ncbi:hypothetical protein [Streptomyces sp. NPDC048508]|uniref:hypothetical protein n=1 Tax=Streptomyces sp. NPDC048508 TaxID=3365561 RepID=UPI0037158EB3